MKVEASRKEETKASLEFFIGKRGKERKCKLKGNVGNMWATIQHQTQLVLS
jgi:hypothetical protein